MSNKRIEYKIKEDKIQKKIITKKEYYQKNKEKMKERLKEYRKNNKDKVKEYNKEYKKRIKTINILQTMNKIEK
jgi:hypothetical protein